MSCNNSSLARQNKSRGSPNAPQNLNQDSSIFSSNPCENHDWDIVSLCLCSLANAFVLINVFPYSGFMVLFLLPRTTPETTGTYAGFLASSFMLGRCVTAVEWGKIADKYGRVCALQVSRSIEMGRSLRSTWCRACSFIVSHTYAGIAGSVSRVLYPFWNFSELLHGHSMEILFGYGQFDNEHHKDVSIGDRPRKRRQRTQSHGFSHWNAVMGLPYRACHWRSSG